MWGLTLFLLPGHGCGKKLEQIRDETSAYITYVARQYHPYECEPVIRLATERLLEIIKAEWALLGDNRPRSRRRSRPKSRTRSISRTIA
jgi:hypothetical protein